MSGRSSDPATGLTPKQERFCLELVKTGNATEAYRQAYNTERMTPGSINVRACELSSNGKVAVRLSQLRSSLRAEGEISLLEHMNELKLLRDMAKELSQVSAAIKAEENRGRVSGHYTERKQISGPGGGPVPLLLMADDGL